jgi:hypothetical protein
MPANTAPIFTLTPDVAWASAIGTTANNVYDGSGTIGTNIYTIFTAGANGSFVERIRLRARGTNIQTVIRVFLNNGSTNATQANNALLTEYPLPATTAAANGSTPEFEIPMNIQIPAGYRLLVLFGTAVAAGYDVMAIGGDY